MEESNKSNQHWLRCNDPKPPLFNDVFPILADAACQTALSQGLTPFRSPCPEASWDTEVFRDHIANIHTPNVLAMPYVAQPAMVQATGQKRITRKIQSGHSARLSAPEELARIIVGLSKQ